MKRVYFIKPIGIQGPVKIGTSEKPAARCAALATWSPFPLEIVAEFPGDEIVEAQFHRMFLEHRQHLEWFTWTAELQAVIDRINAGTFEIASLPRYAGRLASLCLDTASFSDLDLEFIDAKRAMRKLDYRVVGFFHGYCPDIGQFVRIKSDDRKRAIIAKIKAFNAAAQVKAAA